MISITLPWGSQSRQPGSKDIRQQQADAYLGREHQKPPANVGETLHLDRFSITHPLFEQAQNHTYTQDWPPHHALADARALRAGYRAWHQFMEKIWRIES